jgi:hypothetical protein
MFSIFVCDIIIHAVYEIISIFLIKKCTVRPKGNPCRATVKETTTGVYAASRQSHNHQPEAGALLAAKIVTSVKQKALDNVFKPASAIVEAVSNITVIILSFRLKYTNIQKY